jgi:broad specificity phosphatase PhoE
VTASDQDDKERKLITVTDTAQPYLDRLLGDRELQSDLRELAVALRDGFSRAEAKKNQPMHLLGDRKFKQHTQRAAASLKQASARFRGEPAKSHRGRRIVVVLLAIGAVALGIREILKEPGAEAPYG